MSTVAQVFLTRRADGTCIATVIGTSPPDRTPRCAAVLFAPPHSRDMQDEQATACDLARAIDVRAGVVDSDGFGVIFTGPLSPPPEVDHDPNVQPVEAITPNDAGNLWRPAVGLWARVAGNVEIVRSDDTTATLAVGPDTVTRSGTSARIKRVKATGTTAQRIVAVYV